MTSAKGSQLTINFQIEPGAEPKLAAYAVKLGPPPKGDAPAAAPTGGNLSEADALKEIAAAIDRQSRADNFSGTVLVAHNDDVLLEKSVGYFDENADRSLHVHLKRA